MFALQETDIFCMRPDNYIFHAWCIIFTLVFTVKRLITGDDLFGEIGEFKKFAKFNRHQNKNI